MSRVAVIGGGVGGLSVAIRLASAGHRVTLVERNEHLGGKLTTYVRSGFTFDVGPSLVTLPHLLDDTFRAAGTSLDDEVEMVRLDPQFAYRWRDGSVLVKPDDAEATADSFDTFVPGAGDRWREFDAHGARIWSVAERTFFAGPMTSPAELAQRMESRSDLTAIDPLRTLWSASRSFFDDLHLQQWVGRYATYSGSSPLKAPATLSCIPHVESAYGCWYPMGGLGVLRDAFVTVAERAGVELVTGVGVERITSTPDRVTGLGLADGTYVDAEIVISDADADHLYRDLFPDDGALRSVRRAPRSTSGFSLCLGVRDITPDITHHNVWFGDDHLQEFREIDAGQMPSDPTIYGCVSSVTDPTQAPEGDENWFLLINTPPGARFDENAMRDLVLERLARRGVDLRRRLRFSATLTPTDIERRDGTPGGSIYGTSSDGAMAAFARPANRGPKEGLYLVGGSTHPGGGLPLVSIGARIVADLVTADTGAS